MMGLSLPINLIVIIIVVGIVCITLILLLLSHRTPTSQAIYRVGCLELVKDCERSTSEVEFEVGDKTYNLFKVCQELGMDEKTCKRNCGCW